MGSFQTFLCVFLVTLPYIISLSNAYSFSAGGKDGWILSPSESYDAWSKRQRFIIGDIITFKYTQGVDSVLAVNKNDFDTCNINNPITKMDDGNSVFKLDKAGPFYFISGNKSNCDQAMTPMSPAAMTPMSPEIPAMPSSPTMSMPGSEAPMLTPGMGGPVASASTPSGAPPPTSFAAAKLTPSVAIVASIWFVTSLALGSSEQEMAKL
ncbi:early nodulin-like protein 2 [Heracleum sosnowskyi]|uniref:Early nodulin-like protein 2 n=1 Tax=Heracleum sosnowskyi TaxID=360622 RepID=A0AAD8J758_9APIA|nr:early nodulin-like protein 2 [Heracleum sosnowskyi]